MLWLVESSCRHSRRSWIPAAECVGANATRLTAERRRRVYLRQVSHLLPRVSHTAALRQGEEQRLRARAWASSAPRFRFRERGERLFGVRSKYRLLDHNGNVTWSAAIRLRIDPAHSRHFLITWLAGIQTIRSVELTLVRFFLCWLRNVVDDVMNEMFYGMYYYGIVVWQICHKMVMTSSSVRPRWDERTCADRWCAEETVWQLQYRYWPLGGTEHTATDQMKSVYRLNNLKWRLCPLIRHERHRRQESMFSAPVKRAAAVYTRDIMALTNLDLPVKPSLFWRKTAVVRIDSSYMMMMPDGVKGQVKPSTGSDRFDPAWPCFLVSFKTCNYVFNSLSDLPIKFYCIF